MQQTLERYFKLIFSLILNFRRSRDCETDVEAPPSKIRMIERENITPGRKMELGSGLDSYFTSLAILKHIADLVSPFVHDRDIFVDFSCGKNNFAPLLRCK